MNQHQLIPSGQDAGRSTGPLLATWILLNGLLHGKLNRESATHAP